MSSNAPSPVVRDLINWGEQRLIECGVPNARRNSEWMLAHVLDCRAAELYVDSNRKLSRAQLITFQRFVARRATREPLQYILGSTEFMGLPFLSAPGVFIPRPDTEILIERVEAFASEHSVRSVLDLCSGSGVVAVSIAKRLPDVRVVAVDGATEAVELTAKNAYLNDVLPSVECFHSDAISFLEQSTRDYDVIVSNPPYIASGEMTNLPPEVRLHEPPLALDGGRDGLDFYRRAIPLARARLRRGGAVALEIGADQGAAVSGLLSAAGFQEPTITPDYSGHDRVATARASVT